MHPEKFLRIGPASPPVCNSLLHKVTGLRLAASATAQAGWLAVPVLYRHPYTWLIVCKYDVILRTRIT